MTLGMSKHRKSGKVVNGKHFTGKRVGKKVRRAGLSRKQRRVKSRTHENKYA